MAYRLIKGAVLLTALAAFARPVTAAESLPSAKEIFIQSVAIPTVAGRGNVPKLAEYYKGVLRAAGYRDGEMLFTPIGESGFLSVTLKGRAADQPIVLLGHMDVVEARAQDWARDPFTPVEEGNMLFGRGAEDNKYDVAMLVATMARLRQEGFRPRQDLVLVLTGDEETGMMSTRAAAQRWKHAGLVLNGDAGGTLLGEDGKAQIASIQAGEKTYADIAVSITDPGGHSSAPTAGNPIYALAAALTRLGAYRFAPQQNALTRAGLELRAAQEQDPAIKAAILAFLADPNDREAADLLSTRPEYIGQVRTTCTATLLSAGHAPNALPQRAEANINCRIFPGTTVAQVLATLDSVLAEPRARLSVQGDPVATDASPLRSDVVKAVTRAVARRFPGIPVVPGMSAGGTDSMHFRALGIPSYGVSSLAMKDSDGYAHGLNERVPTDGIPGALAYWYDVLTTIAK